VQAVVFRPVVTGADGGGDVRWPELMLEVACMVARADGGGGVHACGWGLHPCHFWVDLIGA
jgi:hypothetical protein